MLLLKRKMLLLTWTPIFHWSQLLISDVQGGTTKAEDVVLLRLLVMKEKETVMVQGMAAPMMVMLDAREILCAEATTARSLDLTIMRRMTAVIFLSLFRPQHQNLRLLLMPH